MTPRRYEQRLRAESAEDTRRRILDAVYERLDAEPGQPVSVEQVARSAGVARSTVYQVFGSRAGLFDALARDVHDRGGFDRVVTAMADPDPRETMRQGIRASCDVFAANRDVHRMLHAIAATDPDTIRHSEARRATGMAELARRLGEHGDLHPDVTVADAAHLLWLATSFDAFDQLYTGRGLPAPEVARLLVSATERAVCRSATR